MTPQTDIIVSCRITREFSNEPELRECIAALSANTQNFRLILVDDASDEQGRACIEGIGDHFRDCIIVRTHFQHWFTRAFNLGLRMARTPWVVLLNSDTIPREGWLEELYAVRDLAASMQRQTRIGLVGSVLSHEETRRFDFAWNPDYVTAHCWLVSMEALYDISNRRGESKGKRKGQNMGQDKRWSTPPESGIRAQEPDELAEKLSRLKKKFAESGRRLTDGTVKGKSVGFVGGVRKPDSKA